MPERSSLQETQPAGNALFGLSVPFADFTSLTFAADTSHLMREHQRWLGCRSETGDATEQWARWLRGRFSTLTYFPFVSVAACWKMGCILLQTPHPATKTQRREAEVITENSMGTLLWQLYDNLYDCQKIFHHLLGDFSPLVNSSSQYGICCERYDALRIIEHSAWKKNKKKNKNPCEVFSIEQQ